MRNLKEILRDHEIVANSLSKLRETLMSETTLSYDTLNEYRSQHDNLNFKLTVLQAERSSVESFLSFNQKLEEEETLRNNKNS